MPARLFSLDECPNVPVSIITRDGGEWLPLGMVKMRILEDGSKTDNRIGAAEFILPANMPGPPAHWHVMHDETFLVTQGTIRFHIPGKGDIDAKSGDYVVVPPGAPHTFANPFDEEARMFSTFTPAFYCNYFLLLQEISEEGKAITQEQSLEAMSRYATLVIKE